MQGAPEPPAEYVAEAFEELSAAQEEVERQQEALAASYQTPEAEQQPYRELFDLAPEAYLVTDIYGTIREANRLAATVLNLAAPQLIGKPLVVFIADEDRPAFRALLTQLQGGRPSTTGKCG